MEYASKEWENLLPEMKSDSGVQRGMTKGQLTHMTSSSFINDKEQNIPSQIPQKCIFHILSYKVKRVFPLKVDFWTFMAQNGFDLLVCHYIGYHAYSTPRAYASFNTSPISLNFNSKLELFFLNFFP
jgi:hypothetical protein